MQMRDGLFNAGVHDGETHARALLLLQKGINFGAIHLTFRFSISFGVINEKREIVRTCEGSNWNLGNFETSLMKICAKPVNESITVVSIS